MTISLCDRDRPDNRFAFLLNFNRTTASLPNHPMLNATQSAIVKEFLKEVTDELMVLFKQRYMEAKAYGEKNPKSYLVFEPGKFVNYLEISPRGSELLDFNFEGQKHFAEDAYELDPRRDNKNVQLTFFKFDPNDDRLPPLFTYTYYFNEDKRQEMDSELPPEQADMVVEINRFIPNLHDILKKRYKEAKKIGEELINSAPKLEFQSHKVSRNEMCPCGSGKKYKKCCALKVH